MNWTLKQLASLVDGVIIGDEDYLIDSIATLQTAKKNQLSFLSNKKYKKYLDATQAGIIIIDADLASLCPNNAIVVDDPYVSYAKIAAFMHPNIQAAVGIAESACIASNCEIDSTASILDNVVIESGVTIGAHSVIGPGSVIKQGVTIGENTRLIANVTLCNTVKIGDRCTIHPGAVIGADGFGIANDQGKWIKIPQIGSVEIGNDVEIGANTTIDRGAIENTEIHNGVKLDNQIQIGHNVVIGENTVIAGCTGIAGSTSIGKNCAIGGGAAIGGHLQLTDGIQLTGMTMVTKSILKSGVYSSGIPAEPTHEWHKNVVRYRQLDKLTARVKQLESNT